MDDALRDHARPVAAEVAGVRFRWTAGCRGYPRPPAGWGLLVAAARELSGAVLDASACLGLPGRAVPSGRVLVLEPSAAGFAAAEADLAGDGAGDRAGEPAGDTVRIEAGLPWDAPPASFDHVLLAPPGERGSARVRAELAAAARALVAGGSLWLSLEKDRGAKRYEKEAAAAVGPLEVVGRQAGWRLSRAVRAADSAPAPAAERGPWTRFDTALGPAEALAGTYASGKLDPGSAVLLSVLDAASPERVGRQVLDLGCGWGPLSRWASRGGAAVTAIDDDLAAVRSARRNAPDAEVLHADLDASLPAGRTFDLVLVNPPFHLGAGVRMALPTAFIAAAARRSRPEGEVWLVANQALPYEERLSERFRDVRTERRKGGFKVLRARLRTPR